MKLSTYLHLILISRIYHYYHDYHDCDVKYKSFYSQNGDLYLRFRMYWEECIGKLKFSMQTSVTHINTVFKYK